MPLSCSEGFTELGYYNGTVSQTDSGAPCLKWTEFPDYVMQYPGRGLGDHSYCRNPDRESNPWCFFRQNSGAIGWAYCDCHQGNDCEPPGWDDPGPFNIIINNFIYSTYLKQSDLCVLKHLICLWIFRCRPSGWKLDLRQWACRGLSERPVGGSV